ncbi:phage repressor protein CI [Buttiauxella agrestis]
MNLEKGGRGAIERMVEAYGFKTRQALCDHLGISKSTLATRYMRDSFPAEWVIQCALETGVSLLWLTNGQGGKEGSHKAITIELPRYLLSEGVIVVEGSYVFDRAFLPQNLERPVFIQDGDKSYIADEHFTEISEGKWLISFDDKCYIREIARIPGNKIRVTNETLSFDCEINEIKAIALIKIIIS